MLVAVFRKFLVLFFCFPFLVIGQSADNEIAVEIGATNFPIERPFTISVIVSNSETRPIVAFPDVPGFTKKGTSASVTRSELSGKTVTNQVITQNYQARAAGRFRLLPFVVTVNGEPIKSEGATLVVSPSAGAPVSSSVTAITPPSQGAAFLQLQTSKSTIYAGEGVALTLSFFVIDNYPYELKFTALDKQLQEITKKIRPANAWEENTNITELKPILISIRGKKFREYRLYQAVFFPLASRSLQLPAVSLHLERDRPVIGPPAPQTETVVFTSHPVTVAVRQLPTHPLRGQVPVGVFRLEERLERQRVAMGQSVRYTFSVVGEGNIATLPPPRVPEQDSAVDIFPPQERQTINQLRDKVTGRKNFAYFMVPKQNGPLALQNRFQWIYFDPQTAQYDTLRSRQMIEVGGKYTARAAATGSVTASNGAAEVAENGSIYAGIEALSSAEQPIDGSTIIRAIANGLLVVMLFGMIFVFFKK